MATDEPIGEFVGKLSGDEGAGIAAVRAKAVVAEVFHHRHPDARGLLPADPRRRRTGKHRAR